MCPNFDFLCQRCETMTEDWHRMSAIPAHIDCPACGAKAARQFSAPAFSTHGDDLNGGRAQYCPALARKMPGNKDDPRAFFTSKRAAREAARRKCDTGDYTLTLD